MRHALPGKALGFTMLEALIAVLILAVGVLSVANLLIKSYRFTQQGAYDTLALQLASNMADRMRANKAMLDSASAPYIYDTNNASSLPATITNFYFVGTSTGCTSGSAVCAAATVPFDLAEWTNSVQAALPGGRGVICRDNPAYSITQGFSWSCSGAATDPLVIKMGWVSRYSAADQGVNVASGVVLGDVATTNASGVLAASPQAVIVVDAGGS